jgi:TRAP transporter TAXI family solute receptor
MDKGETDMGVLTSADATMAYKGIAIYRRPFRNIRILAVGGVLQLSFYVAKDSPMETVADLRGKRIPTEFPGIPIVKMSSTAALATAGVSYDDITRVPVSDLITNAQAFMEGRTDTAWFSVGAPAVEEANARKGGVKFLSLVSTPDAAKRMADIYPGSYFSVVKAGTATGVLKDTTFLTNDIYLVAAKEMSDEAAREILKALWEFNEELGAAHPALKQWRRERMVSHTPFIPYHPGAVKFFKEKGVWNNELETLQAKLMAQ